ncbi:MAG: acyltransferase [Bacteroidales bacterium]|nr:acyltransferase [Bacteroidales bacterium]
MEENYFDDIRPFYDDEIPSAMHTLAEIPGIYTLYRYFYPEISDETVRETVLSITTVDDMQHKIMYPLLQALMQTTSLGVTESGLEILEEDKYYTIVGNHRDIVLDSALLQMVFLSKGVKTSGITFGDNLLVSDLIRIIAKTNKLFITYRTTGMREFLEHAKRLSTYIRYQINVLHQSVWIAQHNGRAKDGNDKTDQGILKMLNMSGSGDFVKDFEELNILPLAISYEYEPCGFLKALEIYKTRRGPYVKKEDEDFNSIITGLTQPKGHIHLSFCAPISKGELEKAAQEENNDRYRELANILDNRIYRSYKLWKTNYVAYDLLNKTDNFSDIYSQEDRRAFETYMNNEMSVVTGDPDIDIEELKEIFLGIYANPVKNNMNTILIDTI